jgi:hypothetical protein
VEEPGRITLTPFNFADAVALSGNTLFVTTGNTISTYDASPRIN